MGLFNLWNKREKWRKNSSKIIIKMEKMFQNIDWGKTNHAIYEPKKMKIYEFELETTTTFRIALC